MSKFTEPLSSAMNNVLAYKLGRIVLKVEREPTENIGDEIDRGLILRRYLEEDGFYLVRLIRDAHQADEAEQGPSPLPKNGTNLKTESDKKGGG